MKPSSLSGRKNCDLLMRKGVSWKGTHFMVRWMKGAPRSPNIDPAKPAIYIGTFASTKLSKSAVERNRMRRRCKEAFRLVMKDMEISKNSSEDPGLAAGGLQVGKGWLMEEKPGVPAQRVSLPSMPIQLLISPRIASLTSSFDAVQNEARAFLTSLPSWPRQHPPKNPPVSSSSR